MTEQYFPSALSLRILIDDPVIASLKTDVVSGADSDLAANEHLEELLKTERNDNDDPKEA
jgi:hypothetical protein